MELNHWKEQRDGFVLAEKYYPGPKEVNVTEIIFDEDEQQQRFPELFLNGRGVIHDYLRVYGPGRIVLDARLEKIDVLRDIDCGKNKERHRRFTEVVSPLLNDVVQTLIIQAYPVVAPKATKR